MPIAPTYPGVYIEEIPSGVRTITGVATSITAFVGYTQRGKVNTPVHIFSPGDFEREFGGLTPDSPLSHAVKHFFTNGGTEGYVVRVAKDARIASTTLKSHGAAASDVLVISAASAGTWGNDLRVQIDYATANPASLFNLTVTELVRRDGDLVPARTEQFVNLTMDAQHPFYAVKVINARSDLVTASTPAVLPPTPKATSTSGVLGDNDLNKLSGSFRIAYSLSGQPRSEIAIAAPPVGLTLHDKLDNLASVFDQAMAGISVTRSDDTLVFTTDANDQHASIHLLDASRDSVTATLKLGISYGGTEVDSAAVLRPEASGTTRTPWRLVTVTATPPAAFTINDQDTLTFLLNGAEKTQTYVAPAPGSTITTLNDFKNWFDGLAGQPLRASIAGAQLAIIAEAENAELEIAPGGNAATDIAAKLNLIPAAATTTVTNPSFYLKVLRNVSGVVVDTVEIPELTGEKAAQTTTEVAQLWQARMTDVARTNKDLALLKDTTVQVVAGRIQILPTLTDPNLSYEFLTAAPPGGTVNPNDVRNVAAYAPGTGTTALSQTAGTTGNNGSTPEPSDLIGQLGTKTGIYALENVDLFNLLVMPDASIGAGMSTVLAEGIGYCEQRRAFMIVDLPEDIRAFNEAQNWIGSDAAASLRSRNVALCFPRLTMPDPFNPSVTAAYGAAGALAGLYARTDAERGLWKAPAGTAATIRGATGLSVRLTDRENGSLNPLGLNCLRTFPVHGTVNWGARTGRGADALADEYKYVPVRRLVLFLEESLYRGTQWVVFEPNDEPLWAQIRLNLGAFMHTLFAQGAFQGRTPREAYFVKCDKETTTQNDIDLGRVNIVVGFAPLKPAEFVVIQIQQIAGAIQT